MLNFVKIQPPMIDDDAKFFACAAVLEAEYVIANGTSTSITLQNFGINSENVNAKSLSSCGCLFDSGKEAAMPRKKKKQFGENEPPLPGFGFKDNLNQMMKEYKAVGDALNDIVNAGPVRQEAENEFELCQEIAMALKQELRSSGISRETFCDLVNEYLGRTEERYKQTPPLCRKPLAKTTLDKMISDPINYPLDSYYLFAFQHIFKSFGVVNAIIGAVDAKVVTGDDRRKIMILKAQEFREKAQLFEKNLGRI